MGCVLRSHLFPCEMWPQCHSCLWEVKGTFKLCSDRFISYLPHTVAMFHEEELRFRNVGGPYLRMLLLSFSGNDEMCRCAHEALAQLADDDSVC